jgi:general secretion pathway protein B
MSLILDALRKAETERQRGAVPGLHSVAGGAPAAPPAPAVGWPSGALAAGLALLVLAAALLWAVMDHRPAPVPPLPQPAAAAAPTPLPVVVSIPTAVPARMPAAPPAEPVKRPEAPIITQVRRLAELPADQRRQLPPLVVGGSVWSEQVSARFVVLDGQVLREGDAAAPGLVLVKLAPRAATLRWRDMLLELSL